MYKPLPNGLTIKQSTVDGLGLFTTKEFKETKVWTGLSDIAPDEQQLTFIYENPKNGNWTIAFYSLKNDKTCILMMGQASTFTNRKIKGSKS